MSSLYLDRKNLAVKLDGQALALYEDSVKKGTVPLHLLDRVVLRGNVQLESRVPGALSERNIVLLVLTERNNVLIKTAEDDIRCYRLPEHTDIKALVRQFFPEDVMLFTGGVNGLLSSQSDNVTT